MADTLCELLKDYDNKKHATAMGTAMHKKMRIVNIQDSESDIVKQIKWHPELAMFFTSDARTEVPVAANINGKFVSRRIDRMIIDNTNHIIHVLDYKTDVNKDTYRATYVAQVREYMNIMRKIYPDYKVLGYILWLHDWMLEQI